jgi:hypothetical protein
MSNYMLDVGNNVDNIVEHRNTTDIQTEYQAKR